MVATSAYGIYLVYKTIKEANDNPNLTRNERWLQFGFGTGELVTSLLPFWGKFKGRTEKTNTSNDLSTSMKRKMPTEVESNAQQLKERPLQSLADPIRDVTGPGLISHPEEWYAMINEMKEAGVKIRIEPAGSERLAYSPGIREGMPGEIIISEDASIGALMHEYQHFIDDRAIGYGGMSTLFNAPLRYTWEFKAYMKEINLMRQQRKFDVAKKLLKNLRDERATIESNFGPVK